MSKYFLAALPLALATAASITWTNFTGIILQHKNLFLNLTKSMQWPRQSVLVREIDACLFQVIIWYLGQPLTVVPI